ncbi:MAG: hypothetical protein AMXMBFR61_22790 [Fimbriimonadales bacterium]
MLSGRPYAALFGLLGWLASWQEMKLCILRSASRDTDLAQNLKLLQMRVGDEYALRYRSRCIHPDLLAADALPGSACLLVYCDPSEYKLIPIRHARLYNCHLDQHSGVFYLQCGPYCDPKAAADWSREFRATHPHAGIPPDGHFVVPLADIPMCAQAGCNEQRQSWREIVGDLAKQDRYGRCFFLFHNGIEADDGSVPEGDRLRVGKKYVWRVLSYNKHLKQEELERVSPIVITDEAVLRAALSASRGLKAYGDIEVALEPCAAGESRLELCLSGVADSTARLKLQVECTTEDRFSQPEPAAAPASDEAISAKLRVFNALCKALDGQEDLRLRVLLESFDAEERTHLRVAEQLIRAWYAVGSLHACTDLLPALRDDDVERLSEHVKRCLLIAYAIRHRRLPTVRPLREFPLFEEEHWTEFRRHVLAMPASSAAELVLSLMREGQQVLVNETDIAELLSHDEIRQGFCTPDKVKAATVWLAENAEPSLAFSFLADRIEAIDLGDPDILRTAVSIGERCQATELLYVVERLLTRLLLLKDGEAVVALVHRHRGWMDPELVCDMLYKGAICIQDPQIRTDRLLEAADAALDIGDRERAGAILDRLRGHLSAVPDLRVEERLEALAGRMEALAETVSFRTPYQEAARFVHQQLVGREIALVGGDFEPEWRDDLQDELECRIDWFQSARGRRIGRNSTIIKGIEAKKYRIVIQLRWTSHSEELRRACQAHGVPLRFSYSSGKESVVRLLASCLQGEHQAPS